MKSFIKSLLLLFLVLTLLPLDSWADRGKLNSALRYLVRQRERALASAGEDARMPEAAKRDKVVATVKFDHVLSAAEITEHEARGISFYYLNGRVARTEAIYPVHVTWKAIGAFTDRADVMRLESAWKPGVYPTLDVSAPEIEADSVWANCTDNEGMPITGKGMIIAVFDSGIDVYHPSFFYADGDTLDWLDNNDNGIFDPGLDAVDLNGNGQYNGGEMLRIVDGWIYDMPMVWGDELVNNTDYVYQTYWDWLYVDENLNGYRDYGPEWGFTDNDPTYGEPYFITLDDNGNGSLDVGEKLVALGTSKILATMNAGEIERLRGVDLILSDPDDHWHGTPVAGILAGNTVGRHIFTGIAPDAEILEGYFHSGIPVSYLIPWARSHGADAMLYEYGGFVEEFLDGSSLDEELVSIESGSSIQIAPSGNLGFSEKHVVETVADIGSICLNFQSEVFDDQEASEIYLTALWRTEISDLTFRLKTPNSDPVVIDGTAEEIESGGYYIYIDFDTSPRGTCKLDLYILPGSNPSCYGTWAFWAESDVELGTDTKLVCNVADDISSWSMGTGFINTERTGEMSASVPSTADVVFVNGSYSTRGIYEVDGELVQGAMEIGEISLFSGRGPRIDGASILDLCSPGNFDIYTPMPGYLRTYFPPGCYIVFGGTSAAGPHVAAGAVLIKQAFPDATVEEISMMLTESAVTDEFTGPVYNEDWGYGKMKLFRAVETEETKGKKGPQKPHGVSGDLANGAGRIMLGQNYPNPFNPSTWIPFYIPRSGSVSVKIFNVKGELVKVLKEGHLESGLWSVNWDGTNLRGTQVGSGVYFCTLNQNGERQTKKLMLLR